MKLNIFLPIIGGALILGTSLVTNSSLSINKDNINYSKEEAKEEGRNAEGYSKWMHEMRSNQITGTINPEDVKAAIDKADEMSKHQTRAFQDMVWQERGPNNQGGRTRALIVDVNNPNKLYMGSAGGGLWISNDNGNNWAKADSSDARASSSICALTQTPNGTIYYGTGESFVSNSAGSFSDQPFILGTGIYKSTNGGADFTRLASTTNPTAFRFVNRLANNGTKVFAACAQGLKASTDEGITWTNVSGLPNTMFEDVKCSGNTVMASTSSGLYVSIDGGATFSPNKISTTGGAPGNGLPNGGGAARIECAIAPSNDQIIYIVIGQNGQIGTQGVYKSIDGGANWSTIGAGGTAIFNPLGAQATWGIAVGVSPLNADMLYVGGQFNLMRYNPSVSNWEVVATWNNSAGSGKFVHADMHEVLFNQTNKSTAYVTTDGGFFRSFNADAPLASDVVFNEKNKNYSTYQCYGVAANRLGWVTAGAQDNGTLQMRYSNANTNQQGNTIGGGDGMKTAMSDFDYSKIFMSIYYGFVAKASDGGVNMSSFKSIFDNHIDCLPLTGSYPNQQATNDGNIDESDDVTGSAYWLTPMHLKEKGNKSVLFLGTPSGVWMCQDAVNDGYSWFKLTTPMSNVKSMYLTEDGNKLFVGTQGGSLYLIDNLHIWDSTYLYVNPTAVNGIDNNWNRMHITDSLINNFSGQVITCVTADPGDVNLIVTNANYGNTTYVSKSPIAGINNTSFVDITGPLPKMPVYGAVALDNNKILLGTELGVWGTDNNGGSWKELNLPSATQTEWHPRTLVTEIIKKNQLFIPNGPGYVKNIIYTGTHGRGTFMSTSLSQAWDVGTSNITENAVQFTVFPNPTVNVVNVKFTTTTSAKATISIYDLRGSIVKSMAINTLKGENTSSLDVQSLTSGAYVIALNVNGEKSASTFVKK
jgi:hypothetical protein